MLQVLYCDKKDSCSVSNSSKKIKMYTEKHNKSPETKIRVSNTINVYCMYICMPLDMIYQDIIICTIPAEKYIT